MTKTNLFDETLLNLSTNKKSTDDIAWVGSKDGTHAMSWLEFEKLARTVNYDSDYGWAEINTSLVVVGEDWWLERQEYDGAEWWEFKSLPKLQSKYNPFVVTAQGCEFAVKNSSL